MVNEPRFHFPTEEIRLTPLVAQKDALAEIRKNSTDIIPQKVLDVYGEVCFPNPPEDRPYLYCSMVLSADGKMAYADNPKGPVIASANKLDESSSKADFWVVNMLRYYSDAVIMGARTLQREPDAVSHIYCEELAEARAQLAKKPEDPISLVVSRTGADIPLDHKIFSPELGAATIICTGRAGAENLKKRMDRPCTVLGPYTCAQQADVDKLRSVREQQEGIWILVTGEGEAPDTRVNLAIWRRMGLEKIMNESPSYAWELMRHRALDEYFFNYAMVYAGGSHTPGATQPFTSESHVHSELLMMGLHKYNFYTTRQRMHYEYFS